MSEQPISNEAADYDGDPSCPSYEALVRTWGYEVVYWRTLGAWQGDHVVGLRDGTRVGVVVIGYGSCSGCDALEGALGRDDADWLRQPGVVALDEDLRAGVKWFDDSTQLRAAVHAWADKTSPVINWWMHDKEVMAAIDDAATVLGAA